MRAEKQAYALFTLLLEGLPDRHGIAMTTVASFCFCFCTHGTLLLMLRGHYDVGMRMLASALFGCLIWTLRNLVAGWGTNDTSQDNPVG